MGVSFRPSFTGVELSAIGINQPSRYGRGFLYALLAASFLPLCLSIFHFEITNARIAQLATVFGFIAILGGVHVWMTIAYYFNLKWLRHFITRPVVFFVVPALITAFYVACAFQPYLLIGVLPVYAITFVNLWHHSKQNWGVISLASKVERGDVSALQKPLTKAWPFFVLPWALTLPWVSTGSFEPILWTLSLISVMSYVLWAGLSAVRGGFFRDTQPTTILILGTALMLYFVPLLALRGKPYYIGVWAFAHGLQYYLIVSLSLTQKHRLVHPWWRIAGAIVVVAIALASLTWIAHEATAHSASAMTVWGSWKVRLVLEIAAAVNLIHFWVDAFIWKFSDKNIRALHGNAFNFG